MEKVFYYKDGQQQDLLDRLTKLYITDITYLVILREYAFAIQDYVDALGKTRSIDPVLKTFLSTHIPTVWMEKYIREDIPKRQRDTPHIRRAIYMNCMTSIQNPLSKRQEQNSMKALVAREAAVVKIRPTIIFTRLQPLYQN